MVKVCILTDSSVQFTRKNFPGHELVHIIPFTIETWEQEENYSKTGEGRRQLVPPSRQEFIQFFSKLDPKYDKILVLTLSSQLNTVNQKALAAAQQFSNPTKIEVIDSKSIGIGLGMLVQKAAAGALEGASLREIERSLRASIPHIYMLFCIPELTYLAQSGYMDYSQALVGEIMGLLPIFSIEEGRLMPMEKVRTQRHLFESFLEFINEFEAPAHIALNRGISLKEVRSKPLRQYVEDKYPDTPFSEHTNTAHLSMMFGPRATGLTIMNTTDKKFL